MSTRLVGELIKAGDLTVNGEEYPGIAIKMTVEDLRGKPLPLGERVVIVEETDLAKLTQERDALRAAAEWLALEVSGHRAKCTCGSCYAVAKAAPFITASQSKLCAEETKARLAAIAPTPKET